MFRRYDFRPSICLKTPPIPLRLWPILIFWLAGALAACQPGVPLATVSASPTDFSPATVEPTPVPTSSPSPTATSLPLLAILLAPAGSNPHLLDELSSGLQDSFSQAGLDWEARASLGPGDLTGNVRLVIALPPDPGIVSLAASAPGVQFLSVGIPGIIPGPNLSVIGAQGARYDQQGFLAGMIAAMITPDWRVGVISISDTAEGKAARQGFINGAVYYCGLCLAYHGPIFDYPQFVELPSSSSPAEWQSAADLLLGQAVKTVYVFPGIPDPALLPYLSQAGVSLLSAGLPPDELRSSWVASLDTDPLPAIVDILPRLLANQGGVEKTMPVVVREVNPELFSPGKQALVEKTRLDLLDGIVDTGIDPLSGEIR